MLLSLKSGVGQDIDVRASPTARNVFFVLISTLRATHIIYFQILSLLLNCVIGKAVSPVGPEGKIGRP